MDFILGLGVALGDTNSEALSLKARHSGAYIQADYSAPEIRELGQGLAESKVYSISVGYEAPLTSKLWVFADVGYGFVSYDVKPNIQTEMVYTHLVSNHYVQGTSIPVNAVPNRGETNGVHTEYDLKSNITGRVGVEFREGDFGFSVSYKHFKPEEFWKLYDDDVVAGCDCWWQETTYRDLSAFEMKVTYTWN